MRTLWHNAKQLGADTQPRVALNSGHRSLGTASCEALCPLDGGWRDDAPELKVTRNQEIGVMVPHTDSQILGTEAGGGARRNAGEGLIAYRTTRGGEGWQASGAVGSTL